MTEDEYRAVLAKFSPEEAAAIDLQRRELTRMGITREPLRTEMACELAEVLLAAKAPQDVSRRR